MSYASAKGRAASHSVKTVKSPPPALSEGEEAAIVERIRLAKEHIPEALVFFRALFAEGLVDGKRSIASVTIFEGVGHESG